MIRSSLFVRLRHWQKLMTPWTSSVTRTRCTQSRINMTNNWKDRPANNGGKRPDVREPSLKMETISTDYLVIGAGAMGVAFADEIINKSSGTGNDGTNIVIVDKRAFPGGHWNDAYDFVRLHQPSYYYGVSSAALGTGYNDLCSKPEILDYFDKAMKKMVGTGRVRFLAQCKYDRDGKIRSMLDEDLQYEVIVRKKTVDASYLNTSVPSTHPPKYRVGNEVSLVPINGLARTFRAYQKFVIVGAGKTGIDAILYLLDRNVDPDKIIWIMPNDSWLWNRKICFKETAVPFFLEGHFSSLYESETAKDMILAYEKRGIFLRLNSEIWPTKFKCATVNEEEFDKLKLIKNVVRQGRVSCIEADEMIFEDGSTYDTCEDYLHVDCTSEGLTTKTPCPIFQGNMIVLQSIYLCQQVYSASVIAGLELWNPENDMRKNEILTPVPHPQYVGDLFGLLVDSELNVQRLTLEGPGFRWFLKNRLNIVHHLPIFKLFMKAGYWRLAFDPIIALKKFQGEVEVKGRKLRA